MSMKTTGGLLRRDYVKGGTPVDFLVDVPNGEYDVTITTGGFGSGDTQNNVQISLEGVPQKTYSLETDRFFQKTFRTTVSDGQLTLNLDDLGTTGDRWNLNGLVVAPAVDPVITLDRLKLDFGPSDSELADGYSLATRYDLYTAEHRWGWTEITPSQLSVSATNHALYKDWVQDDVPGTFVADVVNGTYDITLSMGRSNSISGTLKIEGVTVQPNLDVNASEIFMRTYRATVADGQLTLEFDAITFWGVNELSFRPAADPPLPAPLTSLAVDFGTLGSPVASGYVRAGKYDFHDPQKQFGWPYHSIGTEIDSGATVTSDLRRDYLRGRNAATFIADMANGVYDVSVTMGATAEAQADARLKMEGVYVASGITTAVNVFYENTFRVTVSDGQFTLGIDDTSGGGAYQWLLNSLRIQPVYTGPTAVNDGYSANEDELKTVPSPGVLTNDSGQSLTVITSFGNSALGAQVFANADGSFTYDPRTASLLQALALGATTSDNFEYTVSDANGSTATALVTLTVTGANDGLIVTSAPVAIRVGQNATPTATDIDAYFSDIDGDALTFSLENNSNAALFSSVALDPQTGELQLAYAADQSGAALLKLRATDPHGLYSETDLPVSIHLPPVTTDILHVVNGPLTDGAILGAVSVTDPDANDTHTFAIISGNDSGALAINTAGQITVANATLLDFTTTNVLQFTVRASDLAGLTSDSQLYLAQPAAFSVTGSGTAIQNAAYELALNSSGIPGVQWSVDWGDGIVQTASGNTIAISHLYQSPGVFAPTAVADLRGVSVTNIPASAVEVIQAAGLNLLTNGGFETYVVTHTAGWDIFDEIPGWRRSKGTKLELHRAIQGGAAEGAQYIELDADQDGPNGSNLPGEQGSGGVYRRISVIPGASYELTFAFKARSDVSPSESLLEVQVLDSGSEDPVLHEQISANYSNSPTLTASPGQNGWTRYRLSFTPVGDRITLQFEDVGPDNTVGTLLDDVFIAYLADQAVKVESDEYWLGPTGCPETLAGWNAIDVLTVEAPGVLANDMRGGKTVESIIVTTKPMFVRDVDAFSVAASGEFAYNPQDDWLNTAKYEGTRGDYFKYKIKFTDDSLSQETTVYIYPPKLFRLGSPDDKVVDGEGGLALVGGQKDQQDIMRWIVERANGGDVVVLNSRSTTYMGLLVDTWKFFEALPVGKRPNSITEIVIDKAALAECGTIISTLNKAEAIFIGGGYQGRNIDLWDGTSVEAAIDAAIHDPKRVVGGTSAGAMILGGRDYRGTDSVYRSDVMANTDVVPDSEFVSGFLSPFQTTSRIVDTHLNREDDEHPLRRLGRMLAFLSILNDRIGFGTSGISIDESTALLLNEQDSDAKVMGLGRVLLVGSPEETSDLIPLSATGYQITEYENGESFSMLTPRTGVGARNYTLNVTNGEITEP